MQERHSNTDATSHKVEVTNGFWRVYRARAPTPKNEAFFGGPGPRACPNVLGLNELKLRTRLGLARGLGLDLPQLYEHLHGI